MGLRGRIRRILGDGPGAAVAVGDPRYDEWEVVRDFEDVSSATAWQRHLEEIGIESALTSDWPLDRFGRGDIALRVPAARWSEAEEALGDWDEG